MMPLIIELSHVDYPTYQVSRYESDVEHFLQNEKRFSLDEKRRKISRSYLIKLLEEYGYAKIYDRDGGCLGGVYTAEHLMTISERNKHERDMAFGIA
jgi:hypothetical protein